MTNIDGTILCITIKQQHKENSYLRYRVITDSFIHAAVNYKSKRNAAKDFLIYVFQTQVCNFGPLTGQINS